MYYVRLVFFITNLFLGFYWNSIFYTPFISLFFCLYFRLFNFLYQILPFILGYFLYKYFVPLGFIFSLLNGVVVYMGNNLIVIKETQNLRSGFTHTYFLRDKSKIKVPISLGSEVKCSALISANGYGSIRKVHYQKPKKLNMIMKIRQRIIEKIKKSKYFAFLMSIIIGDRSYLSSEEVTKFKNIGLYHILSISGLHINILILFSALIIRKLLSLSFFISYRFDVNYISKVAAICLGFLYFFISLGSIPTLRALFMAAITLVNDRKLNKLKLLGICALVFIFISPKIILDYSFQLSFLSTAAILIGRSAVSVNFFLLPLLPQFNIASIFVNLIAVNFFSYILLLSFIYLIFSHTFVLFFIDKFIYIIYKLVYLPFGTMHLYINLPLKFLYFLCIIHDVITKKIVFTKIMFVIVILLNLVLMII